MREPSHGDTASVHRIVRKSSHGDTVSVQRIVSLVARSETVCAYKSVQVITTEKRWISSVNQNWIVPYQWISVPVSEVRYSRPASGVRARSNDCKR
jgi:hypothetical protein